MNKSFKTKLENKFDTSIFNFQYFSGNLYKASFDMLCRKNNSNYTANVVVKSNETYEQAIQRYI
jgi:hypothetical protein